MNGQVTSNPAPRPAENLALAQAAFREFHARCFWFMRPDAEIVAEEVPYICERLRADGGRRGFHLAAEIWAETQETFRRATVSKGERSTKMEWAYDSAFRFFPVLSDAELGFVLHPLDGATNKLLALAGRGELRDYLDVLYLHRRVLGLGALAWAACGKDAGFTPQFLIEEAQRLVHYPAVRLKALLLREPVDLVDCKRQWLAAVAEANALFLNLPAEEIGCLYLDANNQAVVPDPTAPGFALLRRHFGSVRGAWPTIAPQ